jgi:hypothetical protein
MEAQRNGSLHLNNNLCVKYSGLGMCSKLLVCCKYVFTQFLPYYCLTYHYVWQLRLAVLCYTVSYDFAIDFVCKM